MSLSANAYGTTAKVAELTPRYADSSQLDFTNSTTPNLSAVENMLNRLSAMANSHLAGLGFDIPLTQADAVLTVEHIVLELAAQMVEGVRGSGRYAPGNKAIAARGLIASVNDDLTAYLEGIAVGLEEMGEPRGDSLLARVAYRSDDESFPLFQRTAFGNAFIDWSDD